MTSTIRLKMLLLTAIVVTGVLSGCAGKEGEASNTPVSPDQQQSNNDTTKGSKTLELEGTVIKSANEDVQLTFPTDWKESKELNDIAIIASANESKLKYAMVIANQKSDFSEGATLDDFVNIFKENTKVTVKEMKILSTKDIEIDDASARLVEFTGVVNMSKVHYLVALIEKNNRFYQIISWSSEAKFSNNKGEYLQIIESFQVLKEDDSLSLSPANKQDQGTTSELKSKSGLVAISLPTNWVEQTNLMPDADIQASRIVTEDYVGVISEGKENFGEGTKLEDYHKLIVDGQENSGALENLKISDPIKIKVDERDALQFEVTGEVNKVKVGYLITLVDHPKHFTQVILWTIDQYFKDRKPVYQDITQTLTLNEK